MTEHLFQIQFPDGRTEQRSLGLGSYLLGREQGDLVLGDPNTSGKHGKLDISASGVTFTDLGSSNGSFDSRGQRLQAPLALMPGDRIRLATTSLSYLRAAQPAPAAAAPFAATQVLPQSPAAWPEHPSEPVQAVIQSASAANPSAASSGTQGSKHSHPGQNVRHSYPLAITSAGLGEALGLLLKTMPFVLVRLGILVAMTLAGIVFWALLIGGATLLAKLTPILAWVWVVGLLVGAGAVWRFVLRYVLYLIKAAHIVVLTELITTGQVGNGSEGMFAYGKRVVTERFGEVNVLFGLDMLIDGIVRAFNRTLNWIANLLPIPGLNSVMGIVNSVLRASTTYIDETIFSYNLARGDDNVYRSSCDGLIYYAQNAKEVLKTGLWVVVLDRVLTAMVWIVMLAPAFVVGLLIPGSAGTIGTITVVVVAVLFASSVRAAILHPLFLIMVMVKFHTAARGQNIDLEWDGRLNAASRKFGELKQQASQWVGSSSSPQTNPKQARPAE